MRRIDGQVLLGFGDFFHDGVDEAVGAARGKAPPLPNPRGKSAGKSVKRPYPKPKTTTTMANHAKVLKASQSAITHAAAAMTKGMRLLSKAPPRAPVHVGAVAAAAMTPKQKLAVAKHNAAVVKQAQASKVLAQHMVATKKSVGTLAQKMIAQKKAVTALRAPGRKGTHVGMSDMDTEVVGTFHEYYSAVGALPDATNPGYLTDGTPDPAYAATGSGAAPDPSNPGYLTDGTLDPAYGMPGQAAGTAIDPTTLLDPATLAALGPAPSMDTYIPDMVAVGGIAYNGAKGTPQGYVGSYGLFTRSTDHSVEPDTVQIDGTEHWGYVWGTYDKLGPEMGIPWGSNLQPNVWNHVHGRFHLGDSGWHDVVDASEAYQSNSKSSTSQTQTSKQSGYGPLVGNPALKDFAAMRVDAQGNMFWLPQEAPDWLTFPIKQAAALTAAAAAKAQKDAAAADAAANAKAQADAAAAQTQQDAANALAESQAQSQSNVSQMQSESDAQQALVQQAQAANAQQALDTEQAKQAGDLMLAQARRQQAYYDQHPEQEFAPPDGGGGGGDDGGGQNDGSYGGGDDGSDVNPSDDDVSDDFPMPGAENGQDADGEGFADE